MFSVEPSTSLQSIVKRCEGPNVAAHLLYRRGVAAERLGAGAGDSAENGQEAGERMFDVDDMPASVGPLADVRGSVASFMALERHRSATRPSLCSRAGASRRSRASRSLLQRNWTRTIDTLRPGLCRASAPAAAATARSASWVTSEAAAESPSVGRPNCASGLRPSLACPSAPAVWSMAYAKRWPSS